MGRGHPWTPSGCRQQRSSRRGGALADGWGWPDLQARFCSDHVGQLQAGGPGVGPRRAVVGAGSRPTLLPAGPPWRQLCGQCPWAGGCPACAQWQGEGGAWSVLVLGMLDLERTGLGWGWGVQPRRLRFALGVVASRCRLVVRAVMERGAWPENTGGRCGVHAARRLPAERGGLEHGPNLWPSLPSGCVWFPAASHAPGHSQCLPGVLACAPPGLCGCWPQSPGA